MSDNIGLSVDQAIIEYLSSYQELNGTTVDELQNEPSPLEFLRYCGKNRPFIVRGGASEWPAVQNWNVEYLKQALGTQLVNVAITPHGLVMLSLAERSGRLSDTSNADSVVMNPEDGIKYFVKPLEIEEPFEDFLNYVKDQELGAVATQAVRYAQTRTCCHDMPQNSRTHNFLLTKGVENDNLRGEYSSLYRDVETDIPWARIALDQRPDAVNLWIGNSRSVTSLHRDNYENVYCQIIGRKHFVLLPPVETACINEKTLRAATYAQNPSITSVSDHGHDCDRALSLMCRNTRFRIAVT